MPNEPTRHRPIEAEAIQWTGSNADELREEIRRVLAAVDGFNVAWLDTQDYGPQADAVLAVLPTPADRDRLAAKVEALEANYRQVAADAMAHGLCNMKLFAQVRCAEKAEAAIDRVRALHVYNEDADYCNVCAERAEIKMRNLLGKDVSILRDRTGGTATPLTLTALRARIEEQPDQLDLFDEGGCGCFTETAEAA